MNFHPWARAARGALKRPTRVLPKPLKEWHIVTGDMVQVLRGRDKGRRGIVKAVNRREQKLIVEGVNTHRRFVPPSEENEGGLVSSEAPVMYNDVSLLDPVDNEPCAIRYERHEGKRVRVSIRSHRVIPKPDWRRRDFVSRDQYEECHVDTPADVVARETYEPSHLTFEEEILKSLHPEAFELLRNLGRGRISKLTDPINEPKQPDDASKEASS